MRLLRRKRENAGTDSGWNRCIRRVRLLVNTALALDVLALPSFVAGAVLGMVLYAGRRAEVGGSLLAACCMAAVPVLAACAWVRLKGRLFQRRDAVAFLDDQLGLNAALCAREEWGSCSASCPTPERAFPLRLRSARCLAWLAGGLGLIVAGAVLPLPSAEAKAAWRELPPPLAEVARAIEGMEDLQTVEEKGLETFREQLDSLERETAADMYSHAGLEAADALKERMAAALMGLESQLQRAGSSLDLLARGEGASAAELASLHDALAEMDSLALKPGGDLGRELQQLRSEGSLCELDPAAARQLRERLAQAASQLRQLGGQCGWCSVVVPDDEPGSGMCLGGAEEGAEGKGPGRGLGRGPGEAPLAFRAGERERLDARNYRLEGADWSRAALGDSLGVEAGAPPAPDPAAGGLEAGGSAARHSQGGDAVWHDQLTPAEQAALKGIFR